MAGVAIRRRARRPVVGSLAVPCCSVAVAPAPPREKGERTKERKNTALRPLLLVPSARLATSVERKGEARQGAGGRNGMRNGRERKRRQGRERPGRDGGRPLVGRASEFRPPSLWDSFASSLWGKNGCARYSNRREREGRTALGTPSASWCYSCSVLGSNLESGDEREMRSTLEVVMKKGFILNSSTRRLLVVEFFNLQNPNCKGIKFC